jgi:hypothetical protein
MSQPKGASEINVRIVAVGTTNVGLTASRNFRQ